MARPIPAGIKVNIRFSSLDSSYLYNTIETKAEQEEKKYLNHGKFIFKPQPISTTTSIQALRRKPEKSTSLSEDNGSNETRVWITMGILVQELITFNH